ncbi:MAG: sce7726 family protein [Rhodococcus qingshengii]
MRAGEAIDYQVLARTFSRTAFRAMSEHSERPFADYARRLIPLTDCSAETTLAEAINCAYSTLASQYRNEYVYKNEIVSRLVFGRHSPRTASVSLELRAGRSIADVVVCNGTTTAYEIKTELDDFSRLAAQLDDYSACFERIFVVTAAKFADRAAAIAPSHVGVLTLGQGGRLSQVRPASTGLGRLSKGAVFGTLRRAEVLRVLKRAIDYEVDVPRSRLWARTRELFLQIPIETVHAEAVHELRHRGLSVAALACAVPSPLRALAYEVPMRGKSVDRLLHRLDERVGSLAGSN